MILKFITALFVLVPLSDLFAAGSLKAIKSPCFQGNGPLCLSLPSGCEGESKAEFCMACDVVRSLAEEGKAKFCPKQKGYDLVKKLFSATFDDCVKTCLCEKNSKLLGCTAPLKDNSKVSYIVYIEPVSKLEPKLNTKIDPNSLPAKHISDTIPRPDSSKGPTNTYVPEEPEEPEAVQSLEAEALSQDLNNSQDYLDPREREARYKQLEDLVNSFEAEIREIQQEINKKAEQAGSALERRRLEVNLRILTLKVSYNNQQLGFLSLSRTEMLRQTEILQNTMLIEENKLRENLNNN